MGIWLTALKVIPWGDVIAAAPVLTEGARKLFTRAQKAPEVPLVPVPQAPAEALATAAQLQAQEALLAQWRGQQQAQQQATAALIDALAAQNAQVVEAIDVLRMRVRLLAWAVAGLGACVLGSLGWALWLTARNTA